MIYASKSLSSITNKEGMEMSSSKQNDCFFKIIERLLGIINELQKFETKIKTLERLNNIDVNDFVHSLLHSLSDEDKVKFKTGMEFMKNELKIILSS